MRKAALSLLTAVTITMIAGTQAHAEIAWQTNLRAAHSEAVAGGKLLLLHFYSDNCTWCERLEAGSFRAPQVGEAVARDFVAVKIHADKNPKLCEMFKVTKFPTDVIVTTNGKTLSHSVSPQLPDSYVAMLTSAVSSSQPNLVAENTPAAAPATTANPQVNAKPEGGTVPSYAQAPQPKAPATAATPSASLALNTNAPSANPSGTENAPSMGMPSPGNPAGFALPDHLSGGVPGQLAGARSDGLTLEMPSLGNAAAETESLPAPKAATPSLEAPAIASAASATADTAASSFANDNPSTQEQNPELAMQGFCAVTVINEDRWAEGSPKYGVIHLGKLYLFVSEDAMQTFLADPTPYTPVLNEIDVVRFFEEKKIVPGKREWGVKDPVYNRMFFFADEAARNHFEKSYERYTDAAIEVMEKAVKEANPGT